MAQRTFTSTGISAATTTVERANALHKEHVALGVEWQMPISGDKTTLDNAGYAHELDQHS